MALMMGYFIGRHRTFDRHAAKVHRSAYFGDVFIEMQRQRDEIEAVGVFRFSREKAAIAAAYSSRKAEELRGVLTDVEKAIVTVGETQR